MRRPKVVTASKTLDETYGEVRVDASAGDLVITLPPASDQIAREYVIKRIDGTGFSVAISAASGDTIDGAGAQALAGQYDSITIKSNGVDTWDIIASTGTAAGSAWTTVKKLGDESTTSDTALTSDAELGVVLPAGRYHIRGKVAFSALDAAMGYKYQLVFNSGTPASIFWHRRHTALSAAAGTDAENTAQGITTPPATAVP